jgi:hypothetical protein
VTLIDIDGNPGSISWNRTGVDLDGEAVDGRVFSRWAMAKVAEDGKRTSRCS